MYFVICVQSEPLKKIYTTHVGAFGIPQYWVIIVRIWSTSDSYHGETKNHVQEKMFCSFDCVAVGFNLASITKLRAYLSKGPVTRSLTLIFLASSNLQRDFTVEMEINSSNTRLHYILLMCSGHIKQSLLIITVLNVKLRSN
jgi:hypothetical protein